MGRAYNKAESLLEENAEKLSKVRVHDVHSMLSMELSVQLFSCMYCIARISVRHSGWVCFLGGVCYHIKALKLHLLQDQRKLLLTEVP